MSSDCSFDFRSDEVSRVSREPDGLQFERAPFALGPDAGPLYWSETHRQAAAVLRQGIENASPIILLTGETGTGKTTLVHAVLAEEDLNLVTGSLPCVRRGGDDFCAWLLLAFGRQVPEAPTSRFSLLQELVRGAHDDGRRCVLIVDEAQDATDDELDALRGLVEMDWRRGIALQVVLAGQPALRARLGEEGRASLASRIAAEAHLTSMGAEDTAGYIRHRLARAGGRSDAFTPAALVAVHRLAQGIPGTTNLLCGACIGEARQRGAGEIDAALVRAVAAAARNGPSARLFREEPDGAARPPEADAPAARPMGAPSPLGRRAPCEARDAARAGTEGERPSGPGRPPGDAVAGGRFPDALRPRSKEPRPAADAPDRIVGRGERGPASGGNAAPFAAGLANRLASARGAAENAEDVRQLAFDAMASLADYGERESDPRRDGSSSAERPPPGAPQGERSPDVRQAADPPPARRVGPSSGARLRLATVAVASALFGIGSYIAWSVHDALSAVPGALPIAAAASIAPPATPSGAPGHADAGGSAAGPARPPPLTTPSLPIIAAPDVSAAGLFSLGLDLGLVDGETAGIAFARAASRGHRRAAYYLAQMYEAGDAVPRNVALARAWYAASGSPQAGEQVMPVVVDGSAGDVPPPRLLSAARTSEGMLELVWTSAAQGDDVRYVVEVLDGVGRSALHAATTALSSYRLAAPEGELLWRVTAETPASASASGLQRIPPAN